MKEPTSFLKIILQRGTYDITSSQDILHECKIAIPLIFSYKIPSSKVYISYTIVSQIMYDGDSLDYGLYVSDIFVTNPGIWCRSDDDNMTEISDLPKGVYIREIPKNNYNKK